MSRAMQILVRSGDGTVDCHGERYPTSCDFTDTIETIDRVPTAHRGWQSVTYKGKRYPLGGGIRTPYFINLQNQRRGGSR